MANIVTCCDSSKYRTQQKKDFFVLGYIMNIVTFCDSIFPTEHRGYFVLGKVNIVKFSLCDTRAEYDIFQWPPYTLLVNMVQYCLQEKKGRNVILWW